MKIHYFQHVPFEGLGFIESWIKEKGFELSSTHFFENHTLPDLNDVDWLIVMGGPMGVYDEDKYEWLKAEKEFIKKAIEADKVVLGICLGSQLVAEVLGANVFPNKFKEIGWFPVEVFEATHKFNFPQNRITVFHWHGDTFELPEGATLAASSRACINQAFRFKDKVVGLQFHLEATPESIEQMIKHCGDELEPNAFIQSAEQIRNNASNYFEQNHTAMRLILEYMESLEAVNTI
ncbi:type 1 glutamine amidotransferase [Solitalea canadensis]|uniref:GMP synthase family protein n=1 Tax=Solitalea canadensis (strain ATCC 29591 / DSM 3403 / JCM 21819 / LMG 8368 / NBRC 15130 / NCIMB 12057 / USAM 9D) TaxID=929556 RepID=H8KRK4_SOLCM|nr:type 1 glutamine amidotransferase [Solitalea canadensis]AFD07585.1 GMP synthase family protein [Solitalea canadensis DSM 3403]